MSTKAQKELERQEEHKDSTALPTLETTQAMSAEEKRAMRGMVVWNVTPPVVEGEEEEVLETTKPLKKSLGGWDELAKHSRRNTKRFSTIKKSEQITPEVPTESSVLET